MKMTVELLIKKLQSVEDKKQTVYLSNDAEGNEIRPLAEIYNANKIILFPTD